MATEDILELNLDPTVTEENDMQQTENKEDTTGTSECCEVILLVFSMVCVILFFPFSLICALSMVQEYERAVIFRLGRILHGGAKGPGLFFVYSCMDRVVKVDLRTGAHDIRPQEILTKDHVSVRVDAVMYFRVIDPVTSVTRVTNAVESCKLLGATTLRNVLGTYQMTEILTERENINVKMKVMLDEATDPWGIDVERVEITDVTLPDMLQRAMAAEAEATREAKAKIIAADGEEKAAQSLRNAAQTMMGVPGALQLRYLQTLNTISAENNSTIVFPLPMEFMSAFASTGANMIANANQQFASAPPFFQVPTNVQQLFQTPPLAGVDSKQPVTIDTSADE